MSLQPPHPRRKPFDAARIGAKGEVIFRRMAQDFQGKDETRFFKSWLDRPLVTGAVSPSGRALAKMMASFVDPTPDGPVIELGPGTGPVTEALIRRGIAENRLVMIEFNPEFVTLLRRRFPKARVIEGDAYTLDATLDAAGVTGAIACLSSLPLFTKSEVQRLGLLEGAFDHMQPDAPFIQFTYATLSPMPLKRGGFQRGEWRAKVSRRVWLNLPPARVWIYRRPAAKPQ